MVDVLIPTYNNYDELKNCLNALSEQTVQHFEVWIAVDGSKDETLLSLPQFISELPFKAHILEHADKENHGRSAARNLALNALKKPFVWLLDSDMMPEPNCLQAHIDVCMLHKNVISVGAIHYQNIKQNIWAKYISTRGHAKYRHAELLPWNYFVTANSMLPTEYLVNLRGFDENIKKYGGEDMEFAYRMHRNYKASFYKNDLAICRTVQEKTLSQALIQLEEYGREGLPYIYKKHPDMPRVYHLDKLEGNKIRKMLYQWLTLSVWTRVVKPLIHFLPFPFSQYLISYLVICAIFKGYKQHKKSFTF